MRAKTINEDITNLLKPKSKEEIIDAALRIKDPTELLLISINKLKNDELVKIALDRGADPNKVSFENIDDKNIVKLLLTNTKTDLKINTLLYKAVKYNLEDDIINLIDNNKINPSDRKCYLLSWSIGYGRRKLFNKIISKKDLEIEQNQDTLAEALSVAIAKGYNDIVLTILKDKRINPTSDNNRPLKVAKEFNNEEALNMLIKDKRISSTKNI